MRRDLIHIKVLDKETEDLLYEGIYPEIENKLKRDFKHLVCTSCNDTACILEDIKVKSNKKIFVPSFEYNVLIRNLQHKYDNVNIEDYRFLCNFKLVNMFCYDRHKELEKQKVAELSTEERYKYSLSKLKEDEYNENGYNSEDDYEFPVFSFDNKHINPTCTGTVISKDAHRYLSNYYKKLNNFETSNQNKIKQVN